MSDDRDLERAFRDGLRRAAEHAEVGVPLAERAHAGARARRRRRWAVMSAVGAVVVAGGVAVTVQHRDGEDGREAADHVTDRASSAPVTEWRSESWHGLTVDVPADWGWGTAPQVLADDEGPALCGGPGADLGPRSDGPDAATPYVGRPIMLSDVCQGQPFPAPRAPYVWLGADVEPGTVDVGHGYTQETVEAFGTTLTVAGQDPGLRRQILDSARATTVCDAHLPARPAVVSIPTEGLDPVHAAEVCAYQEGGDGFDLVYATTLDQDTAQSLYDGRGLGARSSPDFCESKFGEYLRVTFSGQDAMGTAELTADWVVDPGCREVETGPGHVVPLTEAGMEPFSRDGLPVVLRALIGMLG